MNDYKMSVPVYALLVWLSIARPAAYARLLPDYGKNSKATDAEILQRINEAAPAYPSLSMSDRDQIYMNVERAKNGQFPIPGTFSTYMYATDTPPGVTRIIKPQYGTETGLVFGNNAPVDMAPFAAEIAEYAKLIGAITQYDQLAAQRKLDDEKAAAEKAAALKAAQDAAAAQSAAATAAANALDEKKRADFLAAEAIREQENQKRLQQQIIDQATATAAVEAKARADKAAVDALNAKNAAENAAAIASVKKQEAIATTQNTNQVMLNNNVSPGELQTGTPTLLLLMAGAASFLFM